jgi:hypothetical protein
VHLNAAERESTLKIYHSLFNALSLKAPILVYTNDNEYRDVFQHSKRIVLTDNATESDIVLITNERTLNDILYTMNENLDISKKPIMFVTNYHFLKISDKIVGAFYWRKGRSQLLFIKKRLEHYEITLPEEYQRFMIDEL